MHAEALTSEIDNAWVAEVDDRTDSAALSKRIEELLREKQHVVVIVSTPGAGKSSSILQVLRSWLTHAEQRRSLIDLLTPAFDVPTPAAVLQARRNSEARREFLEEFGALTSSEVAEAAGSRAENRSALANRWRKEGRIFAVTLHETLYYPGFQFGEDGRPLPVIGHVLSALDTNRLAEWEVALWFATRSGWLDDERPADLLQRDPDAVVQAATRAREIVT